MTVAVLLAAGSSERFARSCPPSWPADRRDKLQVRIERGRTIWQAAFESLASHPEIDAVGIVAPKGKVEAFHRADALFVTEGGHSRAESAQIGVSKTPKAAQIVLIHDAARPNPPPALIARVIEAAKDSGAAAPCLQVTDTIRKVEESGSVTLDRTRLFAAQTPQGFRREVILQALEGADAAITDEASAVEKIGGRVAIVDGDPANRKITTFDDLAYFRHRAGEVRTGVGYDVHAVSDDPARRLILGGVEFPGEVGLRGHSDADVLTHAIVDALLGAASLGDIGQHFPDTDPEWKDCCSLHFLRAARDMLSGAGWGVVSVDATLVAEWPRLGDRRDTIRQALAKELAVPSEKVNIKATTHEGLGAYGRREGMAAMAVATIERQATF
ncbi:MAG: Bifunctional enzyme IspD/IspF [Fimbriimonadales bacterium]|nr:Bifunctional enzyme IspD/IspF [Fimbriimonadales bacterium]